MAGNSISPFSALEQEFREALRSRSLASGGRFRLLHLVNNAAPVAYLVSVTPGESHLVLPLGAGVTLVGRSSVASYVAERSSLTGIVEGAQWRVSSDQSNVSIRDAGSTNGSVLVRSSLRDQAASALSDLQADPQYLCLGWDGSKQNAEPQDLAEGDLLVNVYGAFLFCPGE